MKQIGPEPGTVPPIRVGLFVTCLVDFFRPSVGFATIKLLEQAGCKVEVPEIQTCCGQPAYNSGDPATARAVVLAWLDAFQDFDHVVVPSGSCGGMLSHHVPELFADDPVNGPRAKRLSERTHELTEFLVDVLRADLVPVHRGGAVTYHDSCAGLRELGVKQQPRGLLAKVRGLELHEMAEPEVCCGFGGTFCVKYSDISNAMVTNKIRDAEASGGDTVLAGDLGCLLNMAGKASREGSPLAFRHVAEALAGVDDIPPIAGTGVRQ
ncbi:MAG: Fe-S oxidoreductase [Rhodospirillaceae bacterium]|nr:Fe-S oxidoreductase [Rhodospirillaceae bacterium]